MDLFTSLEKELSKLDPIRLGIVGSNSLHALIAAQKAQKKNIAQLHFFGDKEKTQNLMQEIGFDAPFTLHEAKDYPTAAQLAVAMAKENKLDILLKGAAETSTVLRAIFNKSHGIPPKKLCSSVSIFQYDNRFVLVSDPAINIYPNLEAKAHIVQNAIDVAKSLGIQCPKVAVLSPTEIVQEKITETVHGEELSNMAEAGHFGEAKVFAMALDVALSSHAALQKNISNPVAGQADILIAHDLNAANILHKCFSLFTTKENGAMVVGTGVPVIITSRSENEITKYNSILLARRYALSAQ